MSGVLEREGSDYWSRIADDLAREIEATAGPRGTQLRLDLFRVLTDRLGRDTAGRAQLDAAVAAAGQQPDVAFSAFRSAATRDSRTRVVSLERLAAVLADTEDAAAISLATAALRERQLEDAAGADLDRATAEQLAPESPNVLLAGVLLALSRKDEGEAELLLERLAHKTTDAAWRLALLAGRAALLADSGAPAAEIERALDAVIGEPRADYVSLSLASRAAAAAGLHGVEVRARERIAEAALTAAPDAAATVPAGRDWDGFARGAEAAAAELWGAALVREQLLGDREGALATVRRIRQIVSTPLAASEEARLLAALGRTGEALDALPEEASAAWRALLALCARRNDDALAAAAQAAGSRLGEGLLAVATASRGEAEGGGTLVADPLTWLYTHPGHPDAPATAAELVRAGAEIPFARQLALETCDPEAAWPTADDRAGGAPWIAAVDSVHGPAAGSPSAFLEWGTRTAAPVLAGLLREAAARAAEDAGDLAAAYEIAFGNAGSAGDPGPRQRQLGRLLSRMGRFPDLAEHLAEMAPIGDAERRATAFHERSMVLEFLVRDPARAAAALDDAIAAAPVGDEGAVFARWRLALRGDDLAAAAEALDELIPGADAAAPRLHLLAGELALFGLGRVGDAVRHLEEAAALPGALGASARLCLALALGLAGDPAAADALYAKLLDEGFAELDGLWTAEALEARRAIAGADGVRRRLERGGVPAAAERVWRVIAGGSEDLGGRLTALAGPFGADATAAACRIAAAALGGAPAALPGDAADPLVATDLALDRADALEAAGDVEGALALVETALERSPAHPGVLGARARLAIAVGRHGAAADSFGRLAGFYTSQDEKARQLARAAAIMQDEIGDSHGAERVIREALRRVPDHAEANDVLTRILRSRGDEAALAKQIEEQIAASREKREDADIIALYEEQADRLLAIDDIEGALAAVDKVLEIEPDRIVSHRTRVDLLVVANRIEEAVQAMLALAELTVEPIEKRSVLWRAAELVGEDLGDVERALRILGPLRDAADVHPTTERIVAKIAARAGMAEEQAEALSRLADLVVDKSKRLSILLELAKVALESLFDSEMSERALYRALEIDPADVAALQMFAASRERGDIMPQLEKAFEIHRARVDEEPLGEHRLAELAEVCALIGDAERAGLCRDVIALLGGKPRSGGIPGAGARPNAPLGPIVESIAHPDERRCPATAILLEAAQVTSEAFRGAEHLPEVGRSTLVAAGADPIRDFLAPWAGLIGCGTFDLHRIGFDPRGAIPALGENPAIAVSADLADLGDTRARFFLARSLWRSARGHGAFAEGDAATPLRWVLALASATLGEEARLPVPTDLEMVVLARKALPRKVRKRITDPCRELLKCSPQELRAWVAGASFSADRFGLLAAGDLIGVVPLVVEESAGEAGLKRLGARTGDTIGKIPRSRELFRFAVAGSYLDLARSLGLVGAGGGR